MNQYEYWRAVILIILFVAACASVFVIAACIISGRISRREEGRK